MTSIVLHMTVFITRNFDNGEFNILPGIEVSVEVSSGIRGIVIVVTPAVTASSETLDLSVDVITADETADSVVVVVVVVAVVAAVAVVVSSEIVVSIDGVI